MDKKPTYSDHVEAKIRLKTGTEISLRELLKMAHGTMHCQSLGLDAGPTGRWALYHASTT